MQLEDDCPQGNDDVRILVLRTLGALDCRQMQCCVCSRACAVYDRYPLIDGTFFVSPFNQVASASSQSPQLNAIGLSMDTERTRRASEI